MSCFNFIIMKVNGADVSNLPYEDAVQLFLKAEEPIIVEVRRKCLNENNKLSFFNYDDDSSYKSPTLAVIASSSSTVSANVDYRKDIDGLSFSSNTPKPAIASISCQTDLSAFDAESKEKVIFMKTDNNDSNLKSEIFFQKKSKPTNTTTTMDVTLDNFDDYLRAEFDFKEITLKKSKSAENLGFTVSYSTDEFLGSDSGSDEYIDGQFSKDDGKLIEDKEYSLLNEKRTPRCKIYVSDIIPNSLADQYGRLRQGDRIFQDDDFLDSAIYCDDKECQEDKYISSNEYEYEQNTFSSSTQLSYQMSKHDQNIANPAIATTNTNAPIIMGTPSTCNKTCKILPAITTENVCDIFNNSNIKVQLETVSKEISLLNSQISLMKNLQRETSMSASKEQHQQNSFFSQKEVKKQTLRYHGNQTELKTPMTTLIKRSPDIPEHIYETIREDTDSDVYYCSPFESVNEIRVEEWLNSICSPNSNINTDTTDRSGLEIRPTRLQNQNNLILDDYDNSSSAYNTGGSCSSAFLALEGKSHMDIQNDNQNCRTLVSKLLKKTNHSSANNETFIQSTHRDRERSNVDRKLDISTDNKCHQTRLTLKPSTTEAIAAADSDGHSTLVAKSSVYRMCQANAMEEYKRKDMSGMVWKVKRRPDGSRYIVRRVIKKQSTMTENNPEHLAIPPESASAVDFDYKRPLYRIKERSRSRHHKAPAPSKDKSHSQHWLV